MALSGYDQIRRLTQGDAADFDVYYKRVPVNQRIVSANLVINANASDADADALYDSAITITADAAGNQIIADGGSDVTGIAYRNIVTIRQGTALMHWILPSSLTATFIPGRDYFYGAQVRSSAGHPHEPEHGVIRAIQQIKQT
jgi:hypothetical protein